MAVLVPFAKFQSHRRDDVWAFVVVAGEGRYTHAASPSAFERHAKSHADFPSCASPLVPHCTRRIGKARLTLDAVTCPGCKPDAEERAAFNVTRELLAECIA